MDDLFKLFFGDGDAKCGCIGRPLMMGIGSNDAEDEVTGVIPPTMKD